MWYDAVSWNTIVVLDAAFDARNFARNAGNFLPYPHIRRPLIPPWGRDMEYLSCEFIVCFVSVTAAVYAKSC